MIGFVDVIVFVDVVGDVDGDGDVDVTVQYQDMADTKVSGHR